MVEPAEELERQAKQLPDLGMQAAIYHLAFGRPQRAYDAAAHYYAMADAHFGIEADSETVDRRKEAFNQMAQWLSEFFQEKRIPTEDGLRSIDEMVKRPTADSISKKQRIKKIKSDGAISEIQKTHLVSAIKTQQRLTQTSNVLNAQERQAVRQALQEFILEKTEGQEARQRRFTQALALEITHEHFLDTLMHAAQRIKNE